MYECMDSKDGKDEMHVKCYKCNWVARHRACLYIITSMQFEVLNEIAF